ncbi:hypothetical protein GS506_02745 [Rhodococcus hoagii]|nr:hypothetical protein [Prescottella equi]
MWACFGSMLIGFLPPRHVRWHGPRRRRVPLGATSRGATTSVGRTVRARQPAADDGGVE